MSSLDTLPTELVESILLYTTPASQRNLVCTCRHLHLIVQPNIYRKIHISLRPENGQDPNTLILKLLRNVSSNPWLAHYVQELEIFGSKPLILSTRLSKAEAQSYMRSLKIKDGVYMYFLNRLMKGDTDAIVAALISLLDNLRVLRLGFDIWSDSRYFSFACRSSPHLEEIELSSSTMAVVPHTESEMNYWDNLSLEDKRLLFGTANGLLYFDPKQLEYIFVKSSIERATLMIPEHEIIRLSLPPNMQSEARSSLTRLHLQQSNLTPSSLGCLLRLTPSLRELRYDHWINIMHGGHNMRYFQCADMDAALQPVLSCLERLCISVDFFTTEAADMGWGYHWGIQDRLTCLSDFTHLAYLEIPIVLLLGWTPTNVDGATQLAAVLPLSVRHLTLTTALEYFECNGWTRPELYSCVGDYIHTVVSTNLRSPKNLQQITLRLCSNTMLGPDHELSLAELRHICLKAEIDLSISEYEP